MQTQPSMEESIWNWLDGQCTEKEVQALQQLINTIPAWKEKYLELQEVHNSLKLDMDLMQPSMRFTKNVMEQIAAISIKATSKNYLNNKIIFSIGAVFATIFLGILIIAFAAIDWSSSTSQSSSNLPALNLPAVDWAHLFRGNLASLSVMILTLIGMVMLDQYLRPKMLKKTKQVKS